MKKTLLFFALIFTLLASSKAGYIIKGVSVSGNYDNLKNYTLTIDNDGAPVSAGSMYHSDGGGSGLNNIVLIKANIPFEARFPLSFGGSDEDFDIEVRDLHYYNEGYVLCGARISKEKSVAFVAEIYHDVLGQLVMNYIEHPGVDIYYSICIPTCPILDYYACGKSGINGAICSIDNGSLHLMNFYTTEGKWEYHKIIEKPTHNCAEPYFVASGRDIDYSLIGFTTLDISFNTNTYVWEQNTNPTSLCVVCDYLFETNKIVLASSYHDYITLNPVIFPVPAFTQISAYQYSKIPSSAETIYCVQDIEMFRKNEMEEPLISVAGYIRYRPLPLRYSAWYGYVLGISTSIPMENNNYSGQVGDYWEHHKIRYDQMGKTYTGGYHQGNLNGNLSNCALFGTPFEYAPGCDHRGKSEYIVNYSRKWSSFNLVSNKIEEQVQVISLEHPQDMGSDECPTFKGGNAPEFAMLAPEKESEITNFYDRITIKDIPAGINYHIYSATGQLIQTGTTNPNISTTQLRKGLYILRLENGKAVKFVK